MKKCEDCRCRVQSYMCGRCRTERRRLEALHAWYERQLCGATKLAKQQRIAELFGVTPMLAQASDYPARSRSFVPVDEQTQDYHARETARIMGGLVPFGPSGLTLYAADLVYLAQVKAQREAAELKVYRTA